MMVYLNLFVSGGKCICFDGIESMRTEEDMSSSLYDEVDGRGEGTDQ